MPKAKLTDAVKSTQAAADAAATVAADAAAATAAKVTADKAETTEDSDEKTDDEKSDDDAEESDDAEKTEDTNDAAKPVDVNSAENFREVFGKSEGSVMFLDKLDFSQACITFIGDLKAANVAQAAEIATLKATNATLAKEVHGSADPVLTGNKAEKTPGEKASAQRLGSEGKATYAASLDAKLAAL